MHVREVPLLTLTSEATCEPEHRSLQYSMITTTCLSMKLANEESAMKCHAPRNWLLTSCFVVHHRSTVTPAWSVWIKTWQKIRIQVAPLPAGVLGFFLGSLAAISQYEDSTHTNQLLPFKGISTRSSPGHSPNVTSNVHALCVDITLLLHTAFIELHVISSPGFLKSLQILSCELTSW